MWAVLGSEQGRRKVLCHEAGGGGGIKKFNTRRLRPEVRPYTLLNTIFGRKGTPFVYLPLTSSTPFVYLPLENNERPF